MKASRAVEIFSGMNPDDEVWITYVTKDDVEQTFSDLEITDENDNLIETKQYVNNSVVESITSSLDNDDYLWERFNDTIRESCSEVLNKLIEEAKEDTELWDKEITDESERVITGTSTVSP
jgi:hypothetical protein